jgi:hypothetical protein
MADIIRLRGSPHEQSQSLLPWYATGTLEAAEAELVEQHLAECADCRETLEVERALASRVAGTPLDIEHGWALLDDRLALRPPPRRPRRGFPRFLRHRATLVWAATAQLAAVALAIVAMVSLRQPPGEPAYHALGAASPPAAGNAVVLFAPDAKASEIRAALDGAHARLVDGPTATGAFLLHVAEAERGRALAGLRDSPRVILAEPLDAGEAP